MKITSAILMLVVSLCASICCPEQDYFLGEPINITNNTLIQIDDSKRTYKLDEYIYITIKIPNELVTNDGTSIEIDSYETYPGVIARFQAWIALYEFSGSESEKIVPFSMNNFDIQKGNVTPHNNEIDQGFDVVCDPNEDSFQSRFGIKLNRKGKYYITSARKEEFVILSSGSFEDIDLRINSKIVDSDELGRFEFTVE